MNLIRYNYYLICNILLSAGIVILPIVFSSNQNHITPLIAFGIIVGIISGLSLTKIKSELYKRITLLLSFVAAIIISFLPFISQYTTNQQLVITSITYSFLTLVLIFVTNFES